MKKAYSTLSRTVAVTLAVLAVACGGSGGGPSSRVDLTPGASTARGAVERFFAAVHAQDLQAMSVVWGTSKGPARESMERSELERREVILQCYFNFDTFRILDESPVSESRRILRVEVTRGNKTRNPTVYAVLGPSSRWYVENLDIAPVRDFCGSAPARP